MTGQAPWMIAMAKEKTLHVAEMNSKGSVKFEARPNVWKPVEASHFPIFRGTWIRTESGQALLTLSDNSRIEVEPKSLFSFDKEGRLILREGGVKFHLLPSSNLTFKIGSLFLTRSFALQASKGTTGVVAFEPPTAGTITVHTNGSVTVKVNEGGLNIKGQDNVLLAAVPKNESITIPSTIVAGVQRGPMVAQVGGVEAAGAGAAGTFLGISTWGWIGIIAGAAAVAGLTTAIVNDQDYDEDRIPICPP